MSIWKVNVRGQEHTVRFASPVFGAKAIFVDDVPIKEVGMTISMWGNYDFDVDGEPAQIKFRAIKSMKGMSLYMNGQKIEPEPGAEMSAETVSLIMIGTLVLFALAFAFGIMNN